MGPSFFIGVCYVTEYLGTKIREEETASLKKQGSWREWVDPVQNLAVFRRLTMGRGHFWEEEGHSSSWSRWCCRWEGTAGRVCLPHICVCVSKNLQGSGWLLSLSPAVRFPPTQLLDSGLWCVNHQEAPRLAQNRWLCWFSSTVRCRPLSHKWPILQIPPPWGCLQFPVKKPAAWWETAAHTSCGLRTQAPGPPTCFLHRWWDSPPRSSAPAASYFVLPAGGDSAVKPVGLLASSGCWLKVRNYESSLSKLGEVRTGKLMGPEPNIPLLSVVPRAGPEVCGEVASVHCLRRSEQASCL